MPTIQTAKDVQAFADNTVTKLEEIDQELQDLSSKLPDLNALSAKMKDVMVLTKAKHFGQPDQPTDEADQKLGEFVKAVAVDGIRGTLTNDQRDILDKARGSVDKEEKAAIGTPTVGDSVTGSYLIPTDFLREIIRTAEEVSELMPLVRKVDMQTLTKSYVTEATKLSFTKVSAQAEAQTESNPTFGTGTLTAETYATWIEMSEEVIEDSAIELGRLFRTQGGEAYGDSFDYELLRSTSSPTGLLNESDTKSYVMGSTSIEDLEVDDLDGLIEALTTVSTRRNAVICLNELVWDRVKRARNAVGDPILSPYDSQPQKMIRSKRVIFSDQMPSADAADSQFIWIGNPKYMLYGDRVPMELRFYPDTAQAVQNGLVYFRLRYRGAYSVSLPASFAILSTSA